MDKSVLVDGYFGFGNLGDEYLALAIVSKFRNTKIIYFRCCVCDMLRSLRKFGQNIVFFSWCNPVVPPLPYILLADEVVIVGGKYLGNVFEDIYLATLTLLTRIFRKKISYMAVGLYSGLSQRDRGKEYRTSIFNKMLYKLAITLADFVSVRGHVSKHTAKSLSKRDIRIELDPLLSYSFRSQSSSAENSNHLVLILKGLDANYFPRFIAVLITFLRTIHDETDFKIVCMEANRLRQNRPGLCELIKSELVNKDHLRNRFTIEHDTFKLLQVLLSARFAVIIGYHASILAIKYDIPSLSIVYEQKIKELEYLCQHVLHCRNIEFHDPVALKSDDLKRAFSHACDKLEKR